MTGICDDVDAEVGMLIRAYLKLQETYPDHELLELMKLDDDKKGFTPVKDFYDKTLPQGFEGPHVNLHAWSNYRIAMEKATSGVPYELPPKPKKIKRRKRGDFGLEDNVFDDEDSAGLF